MLSTDAREDCCPYYDVKISNLETKVVVVKNKDYEALAADVIVESVESDYELQGMLLLCFLSRLHQQRS